MIIMLPPVIEIMIYRLVMWISSAAAELFSVGPVVKLLNALDCGLAIAQSVLVCFSVVFVLCSGILLNCCSD
jgi:stage III sporulation protein AE